MISNVVIFLIFWCNIFFQASTLFEQGLKLIDDALNVKIESFDLSAEQIQLYAEMQNKMRRTR